MIAAIAINAVLAAIVFSGLIVMIMRAIRTSDTEAPAVVPATARRQARTRARRGARALVPARPWA
jgi:hypothetical protein